MKKTAQETVRVALGPRSYDIVIGSGVLPRVGRFLAERSKARRAVVITDANVQKPHAVAAAESLGRELDRVEVIAIEPGEPSKSIETAAALWNGLLELGADRKSIVVAVGGGVVGDLAGFIAATYARGIPFFQVPTSLLAQVDSSVGGKVGIDLPAAKNMVGAFLQPLGVLIDTATLDTLPDRELTAGFAEVAKYGVILDSPFFEFLETNVKKLVRRDHAALTAVVARSCRLKADVVEKDEREETGLRAVLNYGHTFGHAFETLTGYGELLHGEAVAMGMHCSAKLARRLGRVDEHFVSRQQSLLEALGLTLTPPKLDPNAVVAAMLHDKKTEHGRLRFILPDRLGHVELVADVAAADVVATLGE